MVLRPTPCALHASSVTPKVYVGKESAATEDKCTNAPVLYAGTLPRVYCYWVFRLSWQRASYSARSIAGTQKHEIVLLMPEKYDRA